MNPLQEALGSARGARWLGHVGGLAAYVLLAVCGMGGELAWSAVFFLAPALALGELAAALVDRRGRRLKALAARALPIQALGADERGELQAGLLGLPRRAWLRAGGVWGLACAGLLLVGISGPGALLLFAAGAPWAALLPRLVLDLRVRRALPYFELGSDPASALAPWLPPLQGRLREAVLWPLGVALGPVAAMALLEQALAPLVLAGVAGLGLTAAAACAAALRGAVEEPLEALDQALKRLGQGDATAPLTVGDAGLLGRLAQDGREALKAVAERELAWRRFGGPCPPGLRPRVEAGMRPVAVMVLRWPVMMEALGPLAPAARLGALRRLAQAFEKAVGAQGGWVLEAASGAWVALWGAPWPVPEPVQGALAAAWELRALLPVLANQGRLRDGSRLDWGLAVASGQAVCGLGGAQGWERFSAQGAPLEEAWVLAQQGGPWLDPRSADAAQSPFAVTRLPQGLQLTQGPDVQVLPGLGLGFEPGQRL